MDEFERRLKEDAAAIRAEPSDELKARIDASLRGTDRIRPVPETRNETVNLWWASSLTGLAATVAVIALVNWNQPDTVDTPLPSFASEPEPQETPSLERLYSPTVRTADFTDPLEEELVRLQLDIERARENLREDVPFSF